MSKLLDQGSLTENYVAAETKTWSESAVREFLEKEDLSYQDIPLPYGLSTGGRDRLPTANAIFPERLDGKTVLDVGCKYGYFCFEALRRGAKRVIGVDLDRDALRKARILAEIKGVEARFEYFDIERDDLATLADGSDYVLCLNLLHHLHDPLASLDRLVEHTRERLALEVATFSRHDLKKLRNLGPLGWLIHPIPLIPALFRKMPVVFLGSGGKKPMSQQFFLSPSAVETLLRDQRGSFGRVEHRAAQHKGRFVSVADAWRIDELLLVTGPTSAGKSTLIRRLLAGELGEVAKQAGLDDPASWIETDAEHLRDLGTPKIDRLLYHYDFLRPFLRGPNEHRRDRTLDVLARTRELTTLTIWKPAEQLLRQHQEGVIGPKTQGGKFRGKKRQLQIAEAYQDPDQVRVLYENWFAHLEHVRGRHLVVSPGEQGDSLLIETLAAWRTRTRA